MITQMISQLLVGSVIALLLDIPYLMLTKTLILDTTNKINNGKGYAMRYYSAVLVYLAISLGLVVLVLPRINKTTSKLSLLKQSLLYGGLYGLTAYSIFDFTMHFMFKEWSLSLAVMDSIWGGILCSLATYILVTIFY
jgi:uncharacterized membrane protein